MAQQHLDFGTGAPNDGERPNTAFQKIEANFDDLYANKEAAGAAAAAVAAHVAALNPHPQYPVGDRLRTYEATPGTLIPQALNDTHVSGTSLKYTEWYPTTYGIHRWTKPSAATFDKLIITAVSGGGGGGSTSDGTGNPSTGTGADGGAWHRYEMPANDVPSQLVLLVGHGGTAGAWGNPVHGDGQHTLTPGAGGDGGVTAVFNATTWDGLGANDSARLAAFLLLSETNRAAAAIVYCQEGYGGWYDDGVHSVDAPGEGRGRDEPYGPRSFGPGLKRMGASGAGGGPSTDDPEDGFGGGSGTGGSAGGIAQTDHIFKNMAHGPGGLVGRHCGSGAPGKGPIGGHEGTHGGLWGGGGGGGQKTSSEGDVVYNGGFGAPGVIELIEQYEI